MLQIGSRTRESNFGLLQHGQGESSHLLQLFITLHFFGSPMSYGIASAAAQGFLGFQTVIIIGIFILVATSLYQHFVERRARLQLYQTVHQIAGHFTLLPPPSIYATVTPTTNESPPTSQPSPSSVMMETSF